MTTTVELVTVPSADTPGTCIFVHHDARSYIFGHLSEGTQRAFGTRKIQMGSTAHIFLSGPVCWEQMGGLNGYLLSLGSSVESASLAQTAVNAKRQSEGRKLLPNITHNGVDVHGGDNLCHVLAACRAIMLKQPIKLRPHEHRTDARPPGSTNREPDWSDDAISVWKIPIRKAQPCSPRKRPHSDVEPAVDQTSSGDANSPSCDPSPLSDPEVAANVVERIMFNGDTHGKAVIYSRPVRALKPTDKAVILEGDGAFKQARALLIEERGKALANDAPTTAWAFPDPEKPFTDEGETGDSLNVNSMYLPQTAHSATTMSYIVKCHDRRGKFDPGPAKKHGIDSKKYKLLIEGENVTGEDGFVVTPEMVLGEKQPGRGFVVADIPSLDFVDPLLERPEWNHHKTMKHMAVMYWLLGPGVANDVRIHSFIQRFPEIKHIFCADDTCPNMITHPGSVELQVKLCRVDNDRFPIPHFENSVSFKPPSTTAPVELGRVGHKLRLMPRLFFDDAAITPFPTLTQGQPGFDQDLHDMISAARRKTQDASFQATVHADNSHIPNPDAEVIPLGTGSSAPSKHRNVSATLIRVPGIGNYLLDCGEGTLGQIRRAFLADEVADILRKLQCIVISHSHADHLIGTVSLVKAWYEQSLRDSRHTTSLAIVCIARLRTMLSEIAQVEDFGFHRLRFPSCAPTPDEDEREHTSRQDLEALDDNEHHFGLAVITRIPVPHCYRSYGTQLELTSGLRIAYSGDCRPSQPFARACRGAHLLVHECTFDDDKLDHARAKKHCTMGEALAVARHMRARRTLLTHFSQRYVKSECLRREVGRRRHRRVNSSSSEGSNNSASDGSSGGEDADPNFLLAFDLMRVRLGEFHEAACYVPALQKLLEGVD